ncbi:MAG: hypothetical protein VX777_00710 [Chlamydiota bacterium]|nr:hypothetical protein [Chlamydiota bacterium]
MTVQSSELFNVIEGDFPEDPLASASNKSSLEVVHDEEAQLPLIEGKQTSSCFGRMFKVYETNWQCPGITMGACSTIAALAAGVICGVGILIGATGTDVTQQAIGYGIAVTAGIIGSFCLLNCIAHCINCAAIGHYVPKYAFETNVGKLNLERQKLTNEVNELKENAGYLETIVEKQKTFVTEQKTITAEVDEQLKRKTDELAKVVTNLDENIKELAKAKDAIEEFKGQLAQMKNVMCTLAKSNKTFKKLLDDLNITTEELGEQNVEWDKDLDQLEEGNDAYETLNLQAQQLGTALNQQLILFEKFNGAIKENVDRIGEHVISLDQTDDKVVEATSNLKMTIEAKNKQLLRVNSIYEKNRDALSKVREALVNLENIEGWDEIFKPLIDVIDETSDSSFDSDTVNQ